MNFTIEDVGFGDEDLDLSVLALLNKLNKRYQYIGSGRNRAVFLTKNSKNVIKVPLNYAGGSDNFVETKKQDFGFPIPRNKRIFIDDFCCVIMEYVEPVKEWKNLPEWTSWIDCCQVGTNRKGEIVAYDYA